MIQPFQLYDSAVHICLTQYLYISYQRLRFIFCRYFPAIIRFLIWPGGNSVIITGLDQVLELMTEFYLFRNLLSFFFRNLRHIQFITERTCQRNMGPGLKRCDTANCMVRTVTDMGSDGRQRIDQCRSCISYNPSTYLWKSSCCRSDGSWKLPISHNCRFISHFT